MSLVLFPTIRPGMHVIRGPDWQWGNQDGGPGRQGIVINVKDWKGIPNSGVYFVLSPRPSRFVLNGKMVKSTFIVMVLKIAMMLSCMTL